MSDNNACKQHNFLRENDKIQNGSHISFRIARQHKRKLYTEQECTIKSHKVDVA